MKVLVACEYTGHVRDAFTGLGHYALSCDLKECETDGLHYQGDVQDILDDGWDLLISFQPPDTLVPCLVKVKIPKIAVFSVGYFKNLPELRTPYSKTAQEFCFALASQWS